MENNENNFSEKTLNLNEEKEIEAKEENSKIKKSIDSNKIINHNNALSNFEEKKNKTPNKLLKSKFKSFFNELVASISTSACSDRRSIIPR